MILGDDAEKVTDNNCNMKRIAKQQVVYVREKRNCVNFMEVAQKCVGASIMLLSYFACVKIALRVPFLFLAIPCTIVVAKHRRRMSVLIETYCTTGRSICWCKYRTFEYSVVTSDDIHFHASMHKRCLLPSPANPEVCAQFGS